MSTGTLTASVRTRVSDRAWQGTTAAGAVALGGLVVALEGASGPLVVAVGGLAILVCAYVLAPKAVATARRDHGWIAFAVVGLAVSAYAVAWVAKVASASPGNLVASPLQVAGWALLPLLASLLAAGAGMMLLADAVRIWLGLAPRQRAPWKQMTETPDRPEGIAGRAALAVLLIGFAAFVAVGAVGQHYRHRPNVQVLVVLLVFGATMVVLGTPVAIGVLMRVDPRPRPGARTIVSVSDSPPICTTRSCRRSRSSSVRRTTRSRSRGSPAGRSTRCGRGWPARRSWSATRWLRPCVT